MEYNELETSTDESEHSDLQRTITYLVDMGVHYESTKNIEGITSINVFRSLENLRIVGEDGHYVEWTFDTKGKLDSVGLWS